MGEVKVDPAGASCSIYTAAVPGRMDCAGVAGVVGARVKFCATVNVPTADVSPELLAVIVSRPPWRR